MNINKNFTWATLFVKRLENLGVRDVCVSPGSRSTPLTLAFAESKKIKKHIIIDERSSAFFALGIAKVTNRPVAVITTSGTATAELYPAIIEAYLTRVPLIICTADRPEYLRNTGANQTINQENLYANHIRFFHDMRLPKLTKTRMERLVRITDKAFYISAIVNRGPVHLNFPFEKPLEPSSFNDFNNEELFNKIINLPSIKPKRGKQKVQTSILETISNSSKVLILLGGTVNPKDEKKILSLAQKLKSPVIADGTSSCRFLGKNRNVITTAGTIFRKRIDEQLSPEVILQFGKAPTANALLNFFSKSYALKYLVNEFGDIHDPSQTFTKVVKADIENFVNEINAFINKKKIKRSEKFLLQFKNREINVDDFRKKFLASTKRSFEGRVLSELISSIPEKSNLFIGNSTPPRDIDIFIGKVEKNFSIFSNRGASGIDGIVSSAGGIASKSKKPTFLIIGDISFLYNISSLYYLSATGTNLKIVLLNNNGGGIFTMLPVANEKKHFEKFFKTSYNFSFKETVESFGSSYSRLFDLSKLKGAIKKLGEAKGVAVLEIKTDAEYSKLCREKYYEESQKILDDNRKNI